MSCKNISEREEWFFFPRQLNFMYKLSPCFSYSAKCCDNCICGICAAELSNTRWVRQRPIHTETGRGIWATFGRRLLDCESEKRDACLTYPVQLTNWQTPAFVHSVTGTATTTTTTVNLNGKARIHCVLFICQACYSLWHASPRSHCFDRYQTSSDESATLRLLNDVYEGRSKSFAIDCDRINIWWNWFITAVA